MKLQGKVAIITGGASGIGACTARLFVQHGAKVVIIDIQDSLGGAICRELGPHASYVHCDVSNEEDVKKAVDYAVEKYGKLDIMLNNAGIWNDTKPSILEMEKSDFDKILSVNLVGPFLGTKHAARVMIPARNGCIINVASAAAITACPEVLQYACSKRGVICLTENSAVELGKYGIKVNCMSISGVATPMAMSFGIGKEDFEELVRSTARLKGVTLKQEDIANAALFLASDDSKFISGHNLIIDGAACIPNASLSSLMK